MAGSIRLFIPGDLSPGAEVAVSAAQARYLGTVMRRSAGEQARLFNGRDGEWEARIGSIARNSAVLRVGGQLRPQTPDGADLWLAFALLKRDATDLVVQKATELGVTALLPVVTGRTVATHVNLERLAAIATEAAEQSERLSVPAIHPPRKLNGLLETWPADRPLFAAFERTPAPPLRPTSPAALLVGPEGGFTPEERLLLVTRGVQPVSLGPLILRAETACLAGLVLLQTVTGR